jgi:hypothetical protein
MMLYFFVFGLADIPEEILMCPSLMSPSQATTEELRRSINRKLAKFGSLERMPAATRVLVEDAMAEIGRRKMDERAAV